MPSLSVSEDIRLRSESRAVFELGAADRRAMFEILLRHYDCVSWERFNHDLEEKSCVIVLRGSCGEICGFSTQKIMRAVADGVPVKAVFSGDTIVDRRSWGDQELGKAWCRYVADLYAEEPETRLFWFLISKGFRTYLYLPLFFHHFYPCWTTETPAFEQRVLQTLAFAKFGENFNPGTGLVTFPESQGQLKPEFASIPARRLRHPHVRFFLERNPSYKFGTELACLAEISPSNMMLFAGRIMNHYQPEQSLSGGR